MAQVTDRRYVPVIEAVNDAVTAWHKATRTRDSAEIDTVRTALEALRHATGASMRLETLDALITTAETHLQDCNTADEAMKTAVQVTHAQLTKLRGRIQMASRRPSGPAVTTPAEHAPAGTTAGRRAIRAARPVAAPASQEHVPGFAIEPPTRTQETP